MVPNCPERGLEVQRGEMGCPGSHSLLVAVRRPGYLRLEKNPHQSTSDTIRNKTRAMGTALRDVGCPMPSASSVVGGQGAAPCT